jgi:hypothetical protein
MHLNICNEVKENTKLLQTYSTLNTTASSTYTEMYENIRKFEQKIAEIEEERYSRQTVLHGTSEIGIQDLSETTEMETTVSETSRLFPRFGVGSLPPVPHSRRPLEKEKEKEKKGKERGKKEKWSSEEDERALSHRGSSAKEGGEGEEASTGRSGASPVHGHKHRRPSSKLHPEADGVTLENSKENEENEVADDIADLNPRKKDEGSTDQSGGQILNAFHQRRSKRRPHSEALTGSKSERSSESPSQLRKRTGSDRESTEGSKESPKLRVHRSLAFQPITQSASRVVSPSGSLDCVIAVPLSRSASLDVADNTSGTNVVGSGIEIMTSGPSPRPNSDSRGSKQNPTSSSLDVSGSSADIKWSITGSRENPERSFKRHVKGFFDFLALPVTQYVPVQLRFTG